MSINYTPLNTLNERAFANYIGKNLLRILITQSIFKSAVKPFSFIIARAFPADTHTRNFYSMILIPAEPPTAKRSNLIKSLRSRNYSSYNPTIMTASPFITNTTAFCVPLRSHQADGYCDYISYVVMVQRSFGGGRYERPYAGLAPR